MPALINWVWLNERIACNSRSCGPPAAGKLVHSGTYDSLLRICSAWKQYAILCDPYLGRFSRVWDGLHRKTELKAGLNSAQPCRYDVVIWADDSTSMSALDNGERIKDMKAILGRVADAATLFDDDGDPPLSSFANRASH